ncbi:unnamed protein product [Oncorhynchus mykiss]|uniref:Papilin a, proteoglycan-like sulfated glycoprotein n=1 Tax=Oncorhynchus mykiss TaxID=8022 RepID=A0A060WI84_ONCMY|nr:unnamed protein product [Oncorhynchus mykiss]
MWGFSIFTVLVYNKGLCNDMEWFDVFQLLFWCRVLCVLVHSGVSVLDVLAAVVFQLTSPSNDYWGEYGAYGACSRPCGTGVAMRIRQCITARTDGGNNCVGSSKSYRICNMQACPVGSRDFREEQCAQFSRMDFQGKRYTWLPYHGASNPCELNCVPRGENFFYRHRPSVVDGTPCYVGRSDICINGICKAVRNGEIIGMDHDVVPAIPAPGANLRYREPLTYAYTYSAWSECSAPCNSGTQHRSVQCMVQDSMAPHVVDDSYCVSQQLPRPESQQACNQQGCAEYSVSSFSVVGTWGDQYGRYSETVTSIITSMIIRLKGGCGSVVGYQSDLGRIHNVCQILSNTLSCNGFSLAGTNGIVPKVHTPN